MPVIFPSESAEYRRARNSLLDQEIVPRSQMEAVAKARRKLPPGGVVPRGDRDDFRGRLPGQARKFDARKWLLITGHWSWRYTGRDAGMKRASDCRVLPHGGRSHRPLCPGGQQVNSLHNFEPLVGAAPREHRGVTGPKRSLGGPLVCTNQHVLYPVAVKISAQYCPERLSHMPVREAHVVARRAPAPCSSRSPKHGNNANHERARGI